MSYQTGYGNEPAGFFVRSGAFSQSIEQIGETVALPGLACTGIFTHFACADEANEDSDRFTLEQFSRYQKGVAELEKGRPFFAASLLQQRRYHAFSPNASGYGAPRCDFVRPESYA